MDYYINKEDVSKYPLIVFDGVIHLIETKTDVVKYCKVISKSDVIGFDTETKPAFQKGVSYNISLLQLSVHNSVFLFRIDKVGFMQEIVDLLSSPNIKKVGIDIKNDISALQKIKLFEPCNFIDLNSLALQCGFKSIGAVKLSIMLLGSRISKKQRLSDWSSNELTDAQKKYAAIDAWICPKILDVFQKKFPSYFE
jgi:ribonuclease D